MHTNFTPDWLATAHNKKYGEKYHATLSNTEEVHIEEMNLDVLWEEIQSIHSGKFNFPITFSPEINSKADLQRFYLKPEIFFGKICNDSFRNLMIKSDGSVIPSHGRCFNLTVGNVYSQNIKDIWNGSLISEFRKDLMNAGGLFPACSRCCSAF